MRLPVHIWIKEANANPTEIASYFLMLAQRLDEKPQKMRLIVESDVSVLLDFDPKDGNPVVVMGNQMHKFNIRHRWLPEHPIPLDFSNKKTVLLIDPIDSNRFRVFSRRRLTVPNWIYILFLLIATLSVITLHPIAIIGALILFITIISISILQHLKT